MTNSDIYRQTTHCATRRFVPASCATYMHGDMHSTSCHLSLTHTDNTKHALLRWRAFYFVSKGKEYQIR